MANVVDLRELENEDAELVVRLVESLREKARKKKVRRASNKEQEADVLDETFGGWADTLDCEAFKRIIYESRIAGTRPETKL